MLIGYPDNWRFGRAAEPIVLLARAPVRVPVHRHTTGAGRGGAPMPPEQG